MGKLPESYPKRVLSSLFHAFSALLCFDSISVSRRVQKHAFYVTEPNSGRWSVTLDTLRGDLKQKGRVDPRRSERLARTPITGRP